MTQTRCFWGWGYEDEGPDPLQLQAVEAALSHLLGSTSFERRPRPVLEGIHLRPPRVQCPSSLRGILSDAPHERALHSYGRSYRDLVRTTRGEFPNPPDQVALPRTEQDVERVIEECDHLGLAVIPFGGGSSVCGGVEPDPEGRHAGTVSLDLRHLDRVLEIDPVSRAARIQAGVLGPSLEDQLRPSGLT